MKRNDQALKLGQYGVLEFKQHLGAFVIGDTSFARLYAGPTERDAHGAMYTFVFFGRSDAFYHLKV